MFKNFWQLSNFFTPCPGRNLVLIWLKPAYIRPTAASFRPPSALFSDFLIFQEFFKNFWQLSHFLCPRSGHDIFKVKAQGSRNRGFSRISSRIDMRIESLSIHHQQSIILICYLGLQDISPGCWYCIHCELQNGLWIPISGWLKRSTTSIKIRWCTFGTL